MENFIKKLKNFGGSPPALKELRHWLLLKEVVTQLVITY